MRSHSLLTTSLQGVVSLGFVRPCIWLAKKKGGILKLSAFKRDLYIVTDSQCIEQILKDEASSFDKGGEIYQEISRALGKDGLFTVNDRRTWRELRRRMNPAFQRQNLTAMADLTTRLWQKELANWDTQRPVPLLAKFTELSTQMLTQYFCGSSIAAPELVPLAMPVFEGMMFKIFLPISASRTNSYHEAIARLDDKVFAIIRSRRAASSRGNDLLGKLLAHDPGNPDLTNQQLRDQLFTLLMAGFDSTATVMTWACLALADDATLRAQLSSEVSSLLGSRPPKITDLPRLPLLARFLQEVVARHPAFPLFFRHVTRESYLNGRFVVPGDHILIAPETTGRPFGQGSRKCIGEDFATVTAMIALAMLLQRFTDWRRPLLHSGKLARYAMTNAPLDGGRLRFS